MEAAHKIKDNVQSILVLWTIKEYLMVLIENDLLEYEDGQNTYRTTSKGIRLLQIFNNMEELTPLTLK